MRFHFTFQSYKSVALVRGNGSCPHEPFSNKLFTSIYLINVTVPFFVIFLLFLSTPSAIYT